MPFKVEVPEFGAVTIVLTHFSGHLTREAFSEWNKSFEVMGQTQDLSNIQRLYSVMIVPSDTTTDFVTIVDEMRVSPDEVNMAGVNADNFRMMLVSDVPMVKLAVQLAKRSEFFGGQDVPMFRTLDDALAFIALDRQTIGAGAQQPTSEA